MDAPCRARYALHTTTGLACQVLRRQMAPGRHSGMISSALSSFHFHWALMKLHGTHAPNDTTPRVVVPYNAPRGLSVPERSAQLVSSPTTTVSSSKSGDAESSEAEPTIQTRSSPDLAPRA